MQVNNTGIGSFACSQALAAYLRVVRDATNGLAVAGPEDKELGTLKNRHIVSGLGAAEYAPVVLANAQGIVRMVAAGALSAWDVVYGAEGGKIDDTPNTNPIGIALTAATANNDYVDVLRVHALSGESGDERPGLHFEDDFIGDYPAAGTAMTGDTWTKVETLGTGVVSSDEANGVLKFTMDAVAEASTQALYMVNNPIDVDQNPIVIMRVAVFDIGDNAALDINFGVASDTHATDFDAITTYLAFHLDGASLNILAQSDDGVTTVAAVDTTLDAVDDTYFWVKFDLTDKADCKLYIDLEDGSGWQRVLSGTTFDISACTTTLTPIVHVEKTSDNTTADFRLDRVEFNAERA